MQKQQSGALAKPTNFYKTHAKRILRKVMHSLCSVGACENDNVLANLCLRFVSPFGKTVELMKIYYMRMINYLRRS